MKPPAFQFYADDFIGGTITMTNEERGLYILLLALQWTQGSVSEDDILRLSGPMGSPSVARVRAKFAGDPSSLKNHRLETERAKQSTYREAQKSAGVAGAAKRWGKTIASPKAAHSDPINSPMAEGMAENSFPSPSPSPIAERESAERPSIREVQDEAQRIGLAPWKAEDWWNEMEGCGWLDHQSRPVLKWRPILSRVRAKWEADGRPMSPPSNPRHNGNSTNGAPSLRDLQSILRAKETLADGIKKQYSSDVAMGTEWSDKSKRAEWIDIRREIKALNIKISNYAT